MKIKRYTDVIKSIDDLEHIEDLLSTRLWIIQSSNSDNRTNFFMSYLDQVEVNFFEQQFRTIISEYTRENNIDKFDFERAYINCHPCGHPGNWHIDGDNGFTLLYYPLSKTDFGTEGATAFKDKGICYYKNNSIVIFPANIEHMATEHSHKSTFRYTIAFKFQIKTIN